jgi:hypothetical protein
LDYLIAKANEILFPRPQVKNIDSALSRKDVQREKSPVGLVLLKVWFKNWSSNNKLRETYFQKRWENPDSAWLMQKQKSEYALAEYPDANAG